MWVLSALIYSKTHMHTHTYKYTSTHFPQFWSLSASQEAPVWLPVCVGTFSILCHTWSERRSRSCICLKKTKWLSINREQLNSPCIQQALLLFLWDLHLQSFGRAPHAGVLPLDSTHQAYGWQCIATLFAVFTVNAAFPACLNAF